MQTAFLTNKPTRRRIGRQTLSLEMPLAQSFAWSCCTYTQIYFSGNYVMDMKQATTLPERVHELIRYNYHSIIAEQTQVERIFRSVILHRTKRYWGRVWPEFPNPLSRSTRNFWQKSFEWPGRFRGIGNTGHLQRFDLSLRPTRQPARRRSNA
jgi:hypothetical protein